MVKLDNHNKALPAAAAPGGIQGATGYRYWTISISNLEEASKACEDAGYKVVVSPREIRPGVSIAIVEDPEGNWVEFLKQ
jgi:predicted enzyme related to lactoylglutathione lyase